MARPRAKAFLVALAAFSLAAFSLAGATRAAGEEIAPGEGRIRLSLDGRVEEPLRYMRQSGSDAVCEMATWDGPRLFGEVAHCEVIGDGYWRRSYVAIDLLFTTFPFLGDFVLSSPAPRRELVTAVGSTTLYGFDADTPADGRQCVGFAEGYSSAGAGYREVLVGYACADRGPLEDGLAEAVMHGLSVEGSFGALLP